jgi:hypothetical protein
VRFHNLARSAIEIQPELNSYLTIEYANTIGFGFKDNYVYRRGRDSNFSIEYANTIGLDLKSDYAWH